MRKVFYSITKRSKRKITSSQELALSQRVICLQLVWAKKVQHILRNKILPEKIANDGFVIDKRTGEVIDEQLPYDIKHVAILIEIFGMENLEEC